MRISDWSSDVCSSDLGGIHELELGEHAVDLEQRSVADGVEDRAGNARIAHRQDTLVEPSVQPGASLAGKLWSLSMSTSSSSSRWPLPSWSCLSSRSLGVDGLEGTVGGFVGLPFMQAPVGIAAPHSNAIARQGSSTKACGLEPGQARIGRRATRVYPPSGIWSFGSPIGR